MLFYSPLDLEPHQNITSRKMTTTRQSPMNLQNKGQLWNCIKFSTVADGVDNDGKKRIKTYYEQLSTTPCVFTWDSQRKKDQ